MEFQELLEGYQVLIYAQAYCHKHQRYSGSSIENRASISDQYAREAAAEFKRLFTEFKTSLSH